MSKTYLMHLDKTKSLISGFKANYNVVKEYGISQENLSELEDAVREAEKLNQEVEQKRAEVNAIVPVANKKLTEIKNITAGWKRMIKSKIDKEKWINFGIMDKR